MVEAGLKALYDQVGKLIAETSDGGTSYTEYLWLNDTPVAVIKPGSAALYYIHSDHLDTPRLIANQTPATVWRWDNDDPFGANMANANPSGLGTFAFNLRLPGQYFDVETNYHYNTFRDYSPEIGRYIESDPIGIEGGVNTYVYIEGDPLGSTDQWGLARKTKPGGGTWVVPQTTVGGLPMYVTIPQPAPQLVVSLGGLNFSPVGGHPFGFKGNSLLSTGQGRNAFQTFYNLSAPGACYVGSTPAGGWRITAPAANGVKNVQIRQDPGKGIRVQIDFPPEIIHWSTD